MAADPAEPTPSGQSEETAPEAGAPPAASKRSDDRLPPGLIAGDETPFRCGKLAVTAFVKADGRRLLLYEHLGGSPG